MCCFDNKSKDIDLFIVRHAQSKQNTDEYYTDVFHADDAPLSEFGLIQAEKLKYYFEDIRLDKIYTSCLIRTVNTAYPTAKEQGIVMITLPELNEAGTVIHGTEDKKLGEMLAYIFHGSCDGCDAGENLIYASEEPADLAARAVTALKYIVGNANDGDKIMIVSHSAFFGYILRPLLGITLPESFCFKVDNCAVTHISLRKDKLPVLIKANDTSHLQIK